MFRNARPDLSPSRSSSFGVLLVLLLLALAVNTVSLWLVLQEDSLLKKWLAEPGPMPAAEILALDREIQFRAGSRLVVSGVLILFALFFAWQRRRNLDIHDELNRVQRLAHNVLESMAQGVVVVDGDRVVREINPAAVRLLAGSSEAGTLIGLRVDDLPSAGRELGALVERAAERDEPVWDRGLTVERDGLTLRLRADAQAIWTNDGRLSGCILLLRDLTRALLVEERMRRMERIASLGDAATGLVHEIKNPLTALSIHIQLLEEQINAPGAALEAAELIAVLKAEADRLNNVLDGFWNYARLEGLSVRPTDAVSILERVVQLIRPQAERQGVRVSLSQPDGLLPEAPLDPERFQQAVWNLAINALEAMPAGGELLIEARGNDGTLTVSVSDTGPGIPVEIRDDIFKPYFSTKRHGTGLGLALAEKFVGQHRGGISCRTGPQGTSFRLSFPMAIEDGERLDDDG